MAEYIHKYDAINLIEKYRTELPSTYSVGLTTAKNALKGIPTADVVPRSEVERLEAELEDKQFRCDRCDRIALTSSEHGFCVSQAKQEVAREIIDNISRYISLNENISKKCKEENGEQNREYFKGKLSAFLQVQGFIDIELKRQYKVVKNEA